MFLQAERLADYRRLLGGSQPNLDGRQRDLERIQDLFPHDYLGLHVAEPNSTYTIVSVLTHIVLFLVFTNISFIIHVLLHKGRDNRLIHKFLMSLLLILFHFRHFVSIQLKLFLKVILPFLLHLKFRILLPTHSLCSCV